MSSVPLTPEQLSSFSPMDFLTPAYRQQLHASLKYLQRPAGTQLLQKGERALAQVAAHAEPVQSGTSPDDAPLGGAQRHRQAGPLAHAAAFGIRHTRMTAPGSSSTSGSLSPT